MLIHKRKRVEISAMMKRAFEYMDKIDLIPYINSNTYLDDVIEALKKDYDYLYLKQYGEFLFDAITDEEFKDYIVGRYVLDNEYCVSVIEYQTPGYEYMVSVKSKTNKEVPTMASANRKESIIKVKYLADIEPLEKIEGEKSDWIDLRAAEDISLSKDEFKLIPLGVAIQLPEGYEAIVAPRSSTFKKYGIIQTNSIGVIDESYCGNDDQWYMPVYATRNTIIKKNSRICQFRIIKHQPELIFTEVDDLGNENRGGHGSTGEV